MRAEEFEEQLDSVARAVVSSGLFRRTAVQIYADAYGSKIFGAAGISEEQMRWLAEHDVLPHAVYDAVRQNAEHLGGSVFYVPADRMHRILPKADEYLLSGETDWRGPGYWHPDDMLYCPILSTDGRAMGNLTADEPGDGRVPTAATAALLAPFVSLTAALVEKEIGRRRDHLTGCFDGQVCVEEVRRRVRGGRRFGVIFCDMDGLKSVNDREGHAAGDLAICGAAAALKDAASQPPLRAGWVGRLHGDEFLVLFWPDPGADEAGLQAELEVVWHTACPPMSLGVALSRAGESPRELVRRAEMAMYRHKSVRKAERRPPAI